MTRRPLSRLHGFTVSVIVGVGLAGGCIREDEFECENAVAHLQQCCAHFDAKAIECSYVTGCGTYYPQISAAESRCIESKSCDALRATGVCAAADALPHRQSSDVQGGGASICQGAHPLDAGQGASPDDAGRGGGGQPGGAITCTSASGCATGQVCCAVLVNIGTVCDLPPCSSGLQLCASSTECDGGETCQSLMSFSIQVCLPVADASSDAARDSAPAQASTDTHVPDTANTFDATNATDGMVTTDAGNVEGAVDAVSDLGGP
jgi:hypothetical protein